MTGTTKTPTIDPIGYAICQKSGCQQTHGLTELQARYPGRDASKNIKCDHCGGVLTDTDGRAWLSKNPTVITTITNEELDAQRKATLAKKREAVAQAQRELEAYENDEVEDL